MEDIQTQTPPPDQGQQQTAPDNSGQQQQQQKPTTSDPFASVKFEQQKQEGDKSGQKKGDKSGQQQQQQGDKKIARKSDSPEHLQQRVAQQNTKISTQDKELATLRSEVANLRTQGGGDVKALTSQIEQLQQENKRLSGELGAKDFTKSDEYVSKYDKPFNSAAEYAKEIVESLTVLDADGNERTMDWKKDFAMIYSQPRQAALKMARSMFPEDPISADSVMRQYDELKRLDRQRQGAVGEWQKTASDREQRTRSEQLQVQQKTSEAFKSVTEAIRESDTFFHETPDDTERSSLWKQSQAIVDDAYFNRAKKSVQELVTLDAAIRLRAINEPVLRHQLAKVQAELSDYKARFEGKEKSRNGDVSRSQQQQKQEGDSDWKDELKKQLQGAA